MGVSSLDATRRLTKESRRSQGLDFGHPHSHMLTRNSAGICIEAAVRLKELYSKELKHSTQTLTHTDHPHSHSTQTGKPILNKKQVSNVSGGGPAVSPLPLLISPSSLPTLSCTKNTLDAQRAETWPHQPISP